MINDDLVKRALTIIGSSPANHQYFFDSLNSPDWIVPLRKAGRFRKPAQILHEEGGFRLPPWPESKYLSRMAPLAPELVREVILEAEVTDNETVHQDYVEAALQMPVNIAAGIGTSEARWQRSRSRFYTLYPEKVGDLINHLARGGAIDESFALARTLLAILPIDDEARASETDDFVMPLEPKGRFDEWHYRKVLHDIVPFVTQVVPDKMLRLLADLLSHAMAIHCVRNNTPDEDYSFIWRPQVDQEDHQDLKGALVSAVRDAALQMSVTPEATARAVTLLLDRRWRIFRRLGAYVLGNTSHISYETLKETLRSQVSYADSPGSSPEFDQLLTKCFHSLSDRDQDAILGIIEAGPDLEPFKTSRERDGNPTTEQELTTLANRWRLSWLRQIKDDLPEDWQDRYRALVAQFGEPSLNEPRVKSGGGFVGPTSPRTEEDLARLSPSELIEFLRTWQSDGAWNSPSAEGLGRILSAMLTSQPEKLDKEAESLRGLDPTYVRSAIEGFRAALKNGRRIDWYAVLRLCECVIGQPREIPGRKGRVGDRDPDWTWSRTAIARLVLDGLQRGEENSIPIDQRKHVWNIISDLLEDPDPYERTEREYAKGMFIGSLSLNTTCGVSIEAVIDYGLWLRRHGDLSSKGEDAPSGAPEVIAALDRHLFERKSPAIREVYGRRFPWIVQLDRQWARANVEFIFGDDDNDLGQIAWANYILFCRPYDDVVSMIVEQYLHAIDTIGQSFRGENEDIDRHLADHLMTLYWQGKLGLDDRTGPIGRFFAKASDKLRGHAVWTVGRALYDENDELPLGVDERLQQLWEWRLSETRVLKDDREIVNFGYWFASGKLETGWSMKNLLEVLHLRHKAEPDHVVVEHLAEVVELITTESVQALGLLIEGDREGWRIHGWGQHPRTILSTALSGSPAAQQEATRVVNLLGARGHYGYRDLLKK